MYHKNQQEIFIQMNQQQLSYVQTCVKINVYVCVRESICRWKLRLPVDFKDDKVLPSRDILLLTREMETYHNSSILRFLFFTL